MRLLVALTKQQELFHIQHNMSQVELKELKRKDAFFCPQCKEPLILKVGQIKIPHFAHHKNSDCDSYFSEGESAAHLMGKQQLLSLFTKLSLQPILEPYVPQIQQRPDLLLTKGGEKFAIEFQCSKIPAQLVQTRTNGYRLVNIHPIWVIQTPNDHFKTTGLKKISINHTNAQYIKTYKKQRYLITYDVHSETFYYVSNLIWVQGLQYFGVVQAVPLMQQRFPFFTPKIISKATFQILFSKWINYRNTLLRSRLLLSRKGVNDSFIRAVYELNCSVFKMPNFLGLPTIYAQQMNMPNVEWQIQLFYFLHCHQLTPKTMHEKSIPYFLQWAKMNKDLEMKRAVSQYLAIIKKLEIENMQSKVSQTQLINVLYEELVAIG